eukprot:5489987-Pyramimonas_sp.AAC.1
MLATGPRCLPGCHNIKGYMLATGSRCLPGCHNIKGYMPPLGGVSGSAGCDRMCPPAAAGTRRRKEVTESSD